MSLAAGMKKTRKPYTITRPREKWTADEHGRFLGALQLFGRDWKKVQRIVATKTATQIRSHAQKHFLNAQKKKLAFRLPKSRIHHHNNAAATLGVMMAPISGVQQSVAVEACWPAGNGVGLFTNAPKSLSQAWFADALLPDDQTRVLPLSPDDPRFAQVYRFVGDVFGSEAPLLDEAQLQRLQGMDIFVAETILLVLRNLQFNLFV